MKRSNKVFSVFLLMAISALFVTGVSGIYTASAADPAKATSEADLVMYGNITEIGNTTDAPSFGAASTHHAVKIQVKKVFKGEIANKTVNIQVGGGKTGDGVYKDVSTAAEFSEGEEVVVMLTEHRGYYYMTNGYATKYAVKNNTVQITNTSKESPEPERITLEKMEEIVENASVNVTNTSEKTGNSDPDQNTSDPTEPGNLANDQEPNPVTKPEKNFLDSLWAQITGLF